MRRHIDELKVRRIRRVVAQGQLNSAAIKLAFFDFCVANGHGKIIAEEFGYELRELPRLRAALVERTQEWTRMRTRGVMTAVGQDGPS